MAIAFRVGGDLDPLEAAGGHAVVELDPRIPAQVAGDELGDRLAGDDADRFVLVPSNQGTEGLADTFLSARDGLALGRADGHRVIEPLAEDLEVAPLDLVELQALPEPLVEIAEVIDALGTQPEGPADGLCRADDALTGAAVERGQRGLRAGFGEPGGERGHLGTPALAERDVERSLDAVPLVVDRGAGANQHDLGHSSRRRPGPKAR